MSTASEHQPFVFHPATAGMGESTPLGQQTDAGQRIDAGQSLSTGQLVDETRREISQIVREVAAAAGSSRTRSQFLSLLMDRTLRAMAAEGVVVWQRRASKRTAFSENTPPVPANTEIHHFVAIGRLGRVTDVSIEPESLAAHRRLLHVIACDGQPAVVPATPGATDPEAPANPAALPVAVVPIELDATRPAADFLLQVWLEPDGGVATQRGYLRFVAQMADLAGEFLRAERLRRYESDHRINDQIDAALQRLHELVQRSQIEAAITDEAATIFGFARVALCDVQRDPARLLAVSHVTTIDQRSPAAEFLRRVADESLDQDGVRWQDGIRWFGAEAGPTEPSVEGGSIGHEGDAMKDPSLISPDGLQLNVVAAAAPDSSLRLVCLRRAEDAPCDPELQVLLSRFLRQAELAVQHALRLESIPGGRWLAALAPSLATRRRSGKARLAIATAVLTCLFVIALFPAPLIVHASATLRPASVQTVCAHRRATVETIHVRHGQTVKTGDPLVTLSAPDLEEQLATLVGRRAVLLQQQSRWTEALVKTSSHHVDENERFQAQRSLVAEEIQAIDDQRRLLQQVQDSLVIRANRDGKVDAWRIEERLQDRPLRRGEQLLKVASLDSTWLVDALVPHKRIAHVRRADRDEELVVLVAAQACPGVQWKAKLQQIGPTTAASQRRQAATAVQLAVRENPLSDPIPQRGGDDAAAAHRHQLEADIRGGMPVEVMFRCGRAPVAYLLFQDAIHRVQTFAGLYFGDSPAQPDISAGRLTESAKWVPHADAAKSREVHP